MKKFLALLLTVALTATAAVSGTLAYLQSEDSDVNVMTVGNVKIEQHEYQRATSEDGTYKTDTIDDNTSYVLESFEQAKPLYPIVGDPNEPGNSPAYAGGDDTIVRMTQVDSYGSMQVFAGKNAQDKFVTVENIGKSDAYIRTFVAIEVGTGDASLIGTSHHSTWSKTNIGTITIDGNNYYVYEYNYNGGQLSDGSWRHENGVLPAGDTSYPNLSQIYLKSKATNEDMDAIDGNGNGRLDIIVLSQAVQTAGFETTVNTLSGENKSVAEVALNTAFGDPMDESATGVALVAEWFGGVLREASVYIKTGDDMHKSTTNSGNFMLVNDIKTSDYGDDARYGYGYEYIVRNQADYNLDLNGKTITHDTVNENANHNAFTYTLVANHAGTKLTINGDGKIYANNSKGYTCAVQGKDGTLITINGGEYQVDNGIAVWAGAGSHIVINGGSFVNGKATTDHELIYSSGGVIDIYGGFFHNTDDNYTLNIEDRNRATGFINVYGGTYVNFDPSTGGQDPNNIKVAEGYKVVSETQENGDVWYTVVAAE